MRLGVALLQRPITATLGDFSLESLRGTRDGDGASLDRQLMLAIRYYLADRDAGRAGWAYPGFVRDGHDGAETKVRASIDDAVWAEFSLLAEQQDVSTDQLLQHAVLYFAADRDAGRVTERIAEGLERAEG